MAHSNISHNSATLTLSNHSGSWRYQSNKAPYTNCSAEQSSNGVTLSGLSASTSYTFTAYSDDGCETELASTRFTTSAAPVIAPSPALSAGDVTATTATLTLSNYSGNWWHKHTGQDASCTPNDTTGLSGTEANVTGLPRARRTPSRRTETADAPAALPRRRSSLPPHRHWACQTSPTTRRSSLCRAGTSARTASGGTSTRAKTQTARATSGLSNPTANLSNLNANTPYTYTTYSDNGCSTEIAAAQQFTTLAAPIGSNLDQTDNGAFRVGRYGNPVNARGWATAFTVPSGSYTLKSIAAKFGAKVGSPGNITAAIYNNSVTSQGYNRPGTPVITLSGPAQPNNETATYTCSGSCTLSGGANGTIYHMVFPIPGGSGYYQWRATSSDGQTGWR